MTYNNCRFCDNWRDQGLVKYGPRHYAHFRCFLAKGKSLRDLPKWKLGEFPYFLLREFGVVGADGKFVDPVLRERLESALSSERCA